MALISLPGTVQVSSDAVFPKPVPGGTPTTHFQTLSNQTYLNQPISLLAETLRSEKDGSDKGDIQNVTGR